MRIPSIINWQLGAKLALALALVLMIVIAIVAAMNYTSVQDLAEQAGRQRVEEEVTVLQARISELQDRLLKDTGQMAQVRALHQAVLQGSVIDIETTLLANTMLDLDTVDRVLVVDRAGQPLVAMDNRRVSTNQGWLEEELRSLALLGLGTTSIVDAPEPFLVAVAPITGDSNEVIGALAAGLRIDDALLETIDFSRSSVDLAFVRSGEVKAVYINRLYQRPGEVGSLLEAEQPAVTLSPAETLAHYGIRLDAPLMETAMVGIDGQPIFQEKFVRNADDQLFAVAYVPVLIDYQAEGIIAVLVDLSNLDAFRDELFTRQAAALALLGVVSAAILAFLARWMITLPLKRLHVASERIASGEYLHHAEVHSRDEVGQLAAAFNQMASKLQERSDAIAAEIAERERAEQALREAKDTLEQRVVERTLELQQTNQRLEEELQFRIRAEEQITASLREKEVLLKEIHHRVKNNLQVTSSLLRLQSSYLDDPQTIAILQESQLRVHSMALVHERLYQSSDLARISAGDYVGDLVRNLKESYLATRDSIRLEVQVDDLTLDIDTAIPCGLIINELVSNAFKHAFPDGQRGTIQVEVRGQEQRLSSITVRDDGAGFPEQVQFPSSNSLGLQLVTSLTRQLGGRARLVPGVGTTVQICFDD